ncbi:hypothetical protein TNCV_3677741 [Trichonephila clavipes]|nr:hypothetical protein TNCV_3677741 [Trichonephila clavipes]
MERKISFDQVMSRYRPTGNSVKRMRRSHSTPYAPGQLLNARRDSQSFGPYSAAADTMNGTANTALRGTLKGLPCGHIQSSQGLSIQSSQGHSYRRIIDMGLQSFRSPKTRKQKIHSILSCPKKVPIRTSNLSVSVGHRVPLFGTTFHLLSNTTKMNYTMEEANYYILVVLSQTNWTSDLALVDWER